VTGINVTKALEVGLPGSGEPGARRGVPRERYQITRGETASWINGGHLSPDSAGPTGYSGTAPRPTRTDNLVTLAGSQVFPGFAPGNESNSHRTNVGAYADLETH